MPILEAKDSDFNQVEGLGVVIRKTEYGYHSGLLYLNDGQARILHLAIHHILLDELPDSAFQWSNINLDIENKTVLAGLVARIANKNPKVPYAFNSDGVCFDEYGELLPCPSGRGLTCSTFIIAIFATYGHYIVDSDTWSVRPDDAVWHEGILALLERYAPSSHIEAVRADKDAPRFRPEEVVGSATNSDWPVAMPLAEVLAEQVRADLAQI